jgi:hypothetical protein
MYDLMILKLKVDSLFFERFLRSGGILQLLPSSSFRMTQVARFYRKLLAGVPDLFFQSHRKDMIARAIAFCAEIIVRRSQWISNSL